MNIIKQETLKLESKIDFVLDEATSDKRPKPPMAFHPFISLSFIFGFHLWAKFPIQIRFKFSLSLSFSASRKLFSKEESKQNDTFCLLLYYMVRSRCVNGGWSIEYSQKQQILRKCV